jgi:hypothetical protein
MPAPALASEKIFLDAIFFLACCCTGCFLKIPYISTVLLLPILIFKRSYSMYYIQQFCPEFDVFIPEAQASEIQVSDHS